jgi:hypothetical protein
MNESDPIPSALAEITAVLRQGKYGRQADAVERLRGLAISSGQQDQEEFQREITTNKRYWLGMGTIADIVLDDPTLNSRFKRAYYNLAVACQEIGLTSIYSKDVAQIFGGWIQQGIL